MKKDQVFANPLSTIESFKFDASVADVFENMITRSVPGYHQVLELVGLITEKYAVPGTNCYDLGCSLGASTLMMRRHLPSSCHLIAVDNVLPIQNIGKEIATQGGTRQNGAALLKIDGSLGFEGRNTNDAAQGVDKNLIEQLRKMDIVMGAENRMKICGTNTTTAPTPR